MCSLNAVLYAAWTGVLSGCQVVGLVFLLVARQLIDICLSSQHNYGFKTRYALFWLCQGHYSIDFVFTCCHSKSSQLWLIRHIMWTECLYHFCNTELPLVSLISWFTHQLFCRQNEKQDLSLRKKTPTRPFPEPSSLVWMHYILVNIIMYISVNSL